MMEMLITVFSATFFVTIIRTTTPLLLATLGGLVADLSGALNVALEGMMLIGCLTAVVVSVYAPWYVAIVAGLGVGALLGLIMAFFAYRLKADIILVGFAINILAAGGTVFALALATGGDKGTSINLQSQAIPALDLSFLSAIPVVGPVLTAFLSGHSVLSWVAAVLVFAIWYFLYRTPWGLWLRGVGEYPAAPEAAGIPVAKVRTWSLDRFGRASGYGRRAARHVQLCRLYPRHDRRPRLHRAGRRAAGGPPPGRRAARGAAVRYVRGACSGPARPLFLVPGGTGPHDPVRRHHRSPWCCSRSGRSGLWR